MKVYLVLSSDEKVRSKIEEVYAEHNFKISDDSWVIGDSVAEPIRVSEKLGIGSAFEGHSGIVVWFNAFHGHASPTLWMKIEDWKASDG